MWAMTSADRNDLAAYRATGLTPEQVREMQDYQTDPAPQPMWGEDEQWYK